MTKILATAALLALISSGCIFGSRYRTEAPFTETQIRKITPGTTTKQEILDWFGPPIAVARSGEVMKIPAPGPLKEGSQDVQADTFFELFSSKHSLTEQHIIYYYYDSEMKGTEVLVLFFAGIVKARVAENKLWLLIDDRTGMIVDYIFKKAR